MSGHEAYNVVVQGHPADQGAGGHSQQGFRKTMSRDYSKIGGLPYVLPGWMLRYGFERIRPHWHLLTPAIQHKILAVYNQTAHPDSLTITKADLDALSDEGWSALESQLS